MGHVTALDDPDPDPDQQEAESQPEQSFDEFMREMHETSPIALTNGMPSLEWLKENLKTKSDVIRYLGHQLGYTPKEISKHTGLAYQHVYNVLHQQLKRGPNNVYLEQHWQCSHTKALIVIDVVVRKGSKDPNGSRVLYRVCSECAKGIIPGVTDATLNKALPGVTK